MGKDDGNYVIAGKQIKGNRRATAIFLDDDDRIALVEMDSKEAAVDSNETPSTSTDSIVSTSTTIPIERQVLINSSSAMFERRKFSLPGGKEESYNGHLLVTCEREAGEEAGVKGNLLMFLGVYIDASVTSAAQKRDASRIMKKQVKKTNWTACYVFRMTDLFAPTENKERGVIWASFKETIKILQRSKPSQIRILQRYKRNFVDKTIIDRINSRGQCGEMQFGRVELIEKFVLDQELSTKEVLHELHLTINSVPATFGTFTREQLRTPPRFEMGSVVVTPGNLYAILIVAVFGSIDDESSRFTSLRYLVGNCSAARPTVVEHTGQCGIGYLREQVVKQTQQLHVSSMLSSGHEFVKYEGPIGSCDSQYFSAFVVEQSTTVTDEYLRQCNTERVFDRDLQFAKEEHMFDEETGHDSYLRRRNWDVSKFIDKSGKIVSATYFVVVNK